jgi:uncharacterized protein (TIGR04255 family)
MRDLPAKPLVEALVEVRWGEPGQPDPAYPLLVGRLYERLHTEYPVIEDLPLAQFPPVATVHMVRHRFRRTPGGWPLVQIGPGVLTLNETDGYHWDDFSKRAKEVLPKLFEAHPQPDALGINNVLLRYINALHVDYFSENLLSLLAAKLHTSVALPREAFGASGVSDRPVGFTMQLAFKAARPQGALTLVFGGGVSKERPALVWEIHVRSVTNEVPRMPDEFGEWLEAAHALAETWFFELAKGDLLESFARRGA